MIFFTIGTHEPFDRMVKAVDQWAASSGAHVFGQIPEPRPDGYRPRHFPVVARLAPADYDAKVRQAAFLVAHAGMGSIITALQHGKPILIMPRRGHLRETRNDHQWATANRLRGTPGITVAADETDLPALLDRLHAEGGTSPTPISPWASPALVDALRAFIHAPAAGPVPGDPSRPS